MIGKAASVVSLKSGLEEEKRTLASSPCSTASQFHGAHANFTLIGYAGAYWMPHTPHTSTFAGPPAHPKPSPGFESVVQNLVLRWMRMYPSSPHPTPHEVLIYERSGNTGEGVRSCFKEAGEGCRRPQD